MQILNNVLNILLFIAIIVVPMAAIFYGSAALGWGFREYPKITFAIMALIFFGLIFAVLSFHYIFPGCTATYIGLKRGVAISCESQRSH